MAEEANEREEKAAKKQRKDPENVDSSKGESHPAVQKRNQQSKLSRYGP